MKQWVNCDLKYDCVMVIFWLWRICTNVQNILRQPQRKHATFMMAFYTSITVYFSDTLIQKRPNLPFQLHLTTLNNPIFKLNRCTITPIKVSRIYVLLNYALFYICFFYWKKNKEKLKICWESLNSYTINLMCILNETKYTFQ